jgi:radial spoke head protein 4A
VLAVEKQAKQLRFWGKILGFHDYWVIQGLTNQKDADEVAKNVEPEGTGINSYTYWVAHDLLGKWVELPTISPEQLKGAKEIKYVFTGDLDRVIEHYPPFPGK